MHITFFDNVAAQTLSTGDLTLEELRDLILRVNASGKEKLPLLKLARFGKVRSDKNSLRHDLNMISITGIEADYDGKTMSLVEAEQIIGRAGVRALLYTSPSYTAAGPKWRILLPTSAELPPAERDKLMARGHGLFGGVFDTKSFTLSQAYFYGRVNGNPEHVAKLFDGDFIDQRDDLDEGAIYLPGGVAKAGSNQPFTGQPQCCEKELREIMSFIPNQGPRIRVWSRS